MGYFTTYAKNKMLDHAVGKAAWSMPTAYTGYSKADPGADGSGLDEPSLGGYARKVAAAGDWESAADGAIENANVIAHVEATDAQGTITHAVLFDALTGGNVLAAHELASPIHIGDGITPSFAAGAIDASI